MPWQNRERLSSSLLLFCFLTAGWSVRSGEPMLLSGVSDPQAALSLLKTAATHHGGISHSVISSCLQEKGLKDFIPEKNSSVPRSRSRPFVLYYNRHPGTKADFNAISKILGLDWTVVQPSTMAPCKDRGINEERARECWRAVAWAMCVAYDIIVVGDMNSDARPFLEGGCPRPLVIQSTNRFDIKVPYEDQKFWDVMRQAARNPSVWWMANNPYERPYFRLRTGMDLPGDRYFLARPLGESVLAGIAVAPAERAKLAVMKKDKEVSGVVIPNLTRLGLPFVEYRSWGYKGPLTLAQHVGLLDAPYQVSTMALYENMRVGVAYLLPTSAFFRASISPRFRHHVYKIADWARHVEFWHADLAPCFTYFDSWEELVALWADPRLLARLAAKGECAQRLMASENARTIDRWRQLYAAMGMTP